MSRPVVTTPNPRVHHSINRDTAATDAMLHTDKSRAWRFRVTLASALERACRWLAAIVRLILGIVGLGPLHDVCNAIPKPLAGPVYQGL